MASGSAKRYVQAVVELAREQGTWDAWQQDLGVLRVAVSDTAVRDFLENPSVQESSKIAALDVVLATAQP
jgi:F0F1-type ATP synthase delta subunit